MTADSDDVVILSPPSAQKGFADHLLINLSSVKTERLSPDVTFIGHQPPPPPAYINPNQPAMRPNFAPTRLAPNPNLGGTKPPQPQQQRQMVFRYVNPTGPTMDIRPPVQPVATLPGAPLLSSHPVPPNVSVAAPLDSRLILSHVSPLENQDSLKLLNAMNYRVENSSIMKCIECCDQFFFKSSIAHHRDRQVVSIGYNCEICNRKLVFYNKCALFAHVRTHKLNSVDPSKLSTCSLPLGKLKSLSETSLRQFNSQVEQSYAKYQDALKALQSGSTVSNPQSAVSNGSAGVNKPAHITIDLDPEVTPSETNKLSEGSGLTNPAQVVSEVTEASTVSKEVSASSTAIETPVSKEDECSMCHEKIDNLQNHFESSLKECPLCKKFVPGGDCALKAHYLLHFHVPGPCPECGITVCDSTATVVEREVAMRLHLRTQCLHFQRSKVFICLKCDYPPRAFSALRQLADHVIHSHTDKFFKCTVCTLAFKHTAQLTSHLEKEHATTMVGKASRIFKCPVCELIFSDAVNLNKHLTTGSHLPPSQFWKAAMAFRCLDSCRQIFLEKKGLKRHLSSCKFNEVKADDLPCVVCEVTTKFFSNVDELHEHELEHLNTEVGGYCPFCQVEVEKNFVQHLKRELCPPGMSDTTDGVSCHCGTALPDVEAIIAHQNDAVHPLITVEGLQSPHFGPEVMFKCQACDTERCTTEMTEHIFSTHADLCYLCNNHSLDNEHLLECLQSKVIMSGRILEPKDSGNEPEVTSSISSSSPKPADDTELTPSFCPLCLEECSSQEELNKHVSRSHSRGGFKRPVSMDATQLERVKKQRLSQLGGQEPQGDLFCPTCFLEFLSKTALKIHCVATCHELPAALKARR